MNELLNYIRRTLNLADSTAKKLGELKAEVSNLTEGLRLVNEELTNLKQAQAHTGGESNSSQDQGIEDILARNEV